MFGSASSIAEAKKVYADIKSRMPNHSRDPDALRIAAAWSRPHSPLSSTQGRSTPTRSSCSAPSPSPTSPPRQPAWPGARPPHPRWRPRPAAAPSVARCPLAQRPTCTDEDPPLVTRSGNHLVACHFADGQRRTTHMADEAA